MENIENYPSWLVPAGIAKSLKKIGFNQSCEFCLPLDVYDDFNTRTLRFDSDKQNYNDCLGYLSIPTYEQVFEWFRSEGIYSHISAKDRTLIYEDSEGNVCEQSLCEFMFTVRCVGLKNLNIGEKIEYNFESEKSYVLYEDAREELIRKLIEFYRMLKRTMESKPAETPLKVLAFQYVVVKLVEWFEDEHKDLIVPNTLSIIPTMQYLFLLSGVDKENHLFDIFDNFQAWTFTYSEADIYSAYSKCKGIFDFVGVSKDSVCIFDEATLLAKLPEDVKSKIDNAFVKLKEKNINLINYSRDRLTNLTKAHHSYQIYDKRLKTPYVTMDKGMLITEPKYFK